MEFTCLSLNCAQFPFPLGIGDRENRLKLLAMYIKQINPDIIAFQEMWSNYLRAFFYEMVKCEYPYCYGDPAWGKFLLGMHSGLMIISKHPISRAGVHHFDNFRGPEHFAKKGVLGVEILIGEKPINIFTTHLQAGAGGPFFEWWDEKLPATTVISGLEAIEIKKFIDAFVSQGEILLAGDFNIDANATSDAAEWQRCLADLGNPRDTYNGPADKGSTWENGNQTGKRIDHILALTSAIKGDSDIITTIGANVTDHLAVLGKYSVKN